MKPIAALLWCAGLASTAVAQTSARMDLRISLDGVNWVNQLDVAPGTRVHCAMFIGFTGGGYGVSGAVYQITGVGGAPDDSVDISSAGLGRQGTFNFGAATQAVFGDASSFRIDAASDAANSRNAGIASAQNSPPNLQLLFRQDNPGMIYAFDVVVGADGSLRTLSLDLPLDQLKGVPSDSTHGVISIYSDGQATRGTNVRDVTTDGASITVVPTPASVALVGAGVLAAGRRRSGR